jgi:hypothetical protein
MTLIVNLSRREFLAGATLTGVALTLGCHVESNGVRGGGFHRPGARSQCLRDHSP